MEIIVDLDDKRGKENNSISELQPTEVLGKVCVLISWGLRWPHRRSWFSEDCSYLAFRKVLLEKNSHMGLWDVLKTFNFTKVKMAWAVIVHVLKHFASLVSWQSVYVIQCPVGGIIKLMFGIREWIHFPSRILTWNNNLSLPQTENMSLKHWQREGAS